ncbi:MAG: SDR family oxidoreductase [Gammaproteobacteria bacterium]
MDLNGKTVVITGGARGLGRAMASVFAARGATLALLDLNPANLDQARASLAAEAPGTPVHTFAVNVADEAGVIAAMDDVVAATGSLDVCVNNAGIVKDALFIKVKDGQVTGKMTLDQWNAVLNVNLTGVFLTGREAAERMIRLGHGGVLINISSISQNGNVGQTNYCATKAGVVAMMEVWAKELAKFGIRAGAIAPGFCATEILSAMAPETLAKVTAPVPLKRLGQPAEIAQTAVFIAENDFFSGRCIGVDGGLRF